MKLAKILLGSAVVLGSLAGASYAEDQRIHIILCGDDTWGGEVNAAHMAAWEASNPGFKTDIE